MAAAITDLFNEPTTTTRPDAGALTAQKLIGAASITVDTTAGWPTATAVHFVIYQVTAAGVRVEGTQTEWKGIVTSSTAIGTLTLQAGTDQVYPIGSKVICTPTAAWGDDLVEGILTHADQDGTLKAGAVDNAGVIADGIITPAKLTTALQGDWKVGMLPAVSSVTENGNRSADMNFASTVANLLTPGMRIRTSRTVAAPTSCFSLDGSNDYYNDTTVSGMSFTDDFCGGAWIYPTAYQTGHVISRYNGTSGWYLGLNSTGQVIFYGHSGGAGNYRGVQSYQSVPLNKWTYIEAQLDMSAHAVGATNSYVTIGGVDVPAQVAQGGTNPVSLTQAGNLEIGSSNGGTSVFAGYIDQPFVSSAKITQANVRTLMNQALTSSLVSTNSIVSAYSGGSTTDINTTNANNLTAQNGATTATRSPFCTDANGTPGGTYDWGIVTKVATTVATVQYPEGCAIPTSGGISAVDMSGVKAPFGMPTQQSRWELVCLGRSIVSQNPPVAGTWYNIASIQMNIPVGSWVATKNVVVVLGCTATTTLAVNSTLSTSASAETDLSMSEAGAVIGTNMSQGYWPMTRTGFIDVTAATTYYLISKMAVGGASPILYNDGSQSTTMIKAVLAYL